MKNKFLKRLLVFSFIILFIFLFRYCWVSFPVMTGYGAKVLCSGIFISGRDEKNVIDQDLGFSPLNLLKYNINYKDSTVTASVFGLAERKAIFRKGLGACLVVQCSEEELRSQRFRLANPLSINQDSLDWPEGDRINTAMPSNVDTNKLRIAINGAFIENDSAHLIRTRAVIVVYNGEIIAEQYAPGINKDMPLTGWSMTKTLTGALIGLLVKEGKLQDNQLAPVPEWKDPNDSRHQITIANLLQQASGLDFEEDYSKYSDATRMLFMRANMSAYTASRPLKYSPGSVFYYSSGNSNILSGIIRRTIGEKDYHAYPYEKLFYKLGMYHTTMECDASGTFVGSSYCYATARDWARFGLFFLNGGKTKEAQLLPDDWVTKSVTPAPAAKQGQYGYQIWLNAGQKNNNTNRKFPGLPTDLFYANGFEGQNVFILPSKHMVVVRLGMTQHGGFDPEAFLNPILSSIK